MPEPTANDSGWTDADLGRWAAYGVGGVDAAGLASQLACSLLSARDKITELSRFLEETQLARQAYKRERDEARDRVNELEARIGGMRG